MITIAELVRNLQLITIVQAADQDMINVTGCYLGDLLSNVIAKAETGNLWFTVMTNVNVIAVAQLLGLAGVVIIEGHQPMPETVAKAKAENILLFSRQDNAYTAACRFKEAGII